MELLSTEQRFSKWVDQHSGKLGILGGVLVAAALGSGLYLYSRYGEQIKDELFKMAIPLAAVLGLMYLSEKGGAATLSEIKKFGKLALPGVAIGGMIGLGAWYQLR